jgi:hypothetical protein
MAQNKPSLVFVAYLLLIASLPLGVTALILAAFALMALISSPESGGGLRSSLSFLILSLIAGSGCVLMIKFTFPAFVTITLFGCQIGAEIEVRTIGGVTIFVVTRDDKEPACVSSINVSEGNGTISSASKWSLNQNHAAGQAGKNVCNHLFVFGKPIKGYEQQYDGKPLKPGKTY